jgi:hypothetical protein
MSDSTNASTTGGSLNELAGQYCVELERLNYGRETIKLYLRSIRRLSQLMVSHGLALDQLTPEIAAELLLRTEWHGDRSLSEKWVGRSTAPSLIHVMKRRLDWKLAPH